MQQNKKEQLQGSFGKYLTSQDGTKIYYDVNSVGSDTYLIFLHGFGGDLTAWNRVRTPLGELGYSSIDIDLRGHGLSGDPKGKQYYTISRFVEDVREIIKQENVEKFVLIGHCLGGMVAIELEANHPKTADALILIDTSYKPPRRGKLFNNNVFLDKILSFLARYAPVTKEIQRVDFSRFVGTGDYNVARISSDIWHTSPQSYLYILRTILNFDATLLLEKIAVPTLVIVGKQDSIFPPRVAEEIANKSKDKLNFNRRKGL